MAANTTITVPLENRSFSSHADGFSDTLPSFERRVWKIAAADTALIITSPPTSDATYPAQAQTWLQSVLDGISIGNTQERTPAELDSIRQTAAQHIVNLLGFRDRDGDGIMDKDDAFPNDPKEAVDTDHDGIGNIVFLNDL